MLNGKNQNTIIIVETVILVALLFLLIFGLNHPLWQKQDNYYAIYLKTGGIYFGKLVRFSHYKLEDPYLLNINQNQGGKISVQKFQNAFWAPEPEIKINPENVVWIARLSSQSPVVKYMKGEITQQLNQQSKPALNNTSSLNFNKDGKSDNGK